jgi:protoporphyrinogen oxidase
MKIGIIGGGWTGLVLAHQLSQMEHEISIFERENQLGGLATYHHYGDFFWDRFYHVILPTDKALLGFMADIGLGDRIRWQQTLTGVYVDKAFHSVSTTKEFLLFPPLNMWQKFRLGLTIFLGARIRNWRKLEKITVEDWLIQYSGRTTYEKFWKPLLLAKLGESYQRVSAVFIWTYIKRLFEAREDSSARKEQMGYLEGGYKTALDHLEQQLTGRDVRIQLNTSVAHIEPNADGGVWVTANKQRELFDKVIFTGPVNVLQQVVDPRLVAVSESSRAIEYLGVICMVLVLDRPLTPFYVLNIADDRIPFTGVIGMSTLVDTEQTGGHYLVYLPKYVVSDHPLLKQSDEAIKALFYQGLFAMYPELKAAHIVSMHINRAFKVQPLQVLNYSEIIPQVRTLHPDFYVLNTSQFVNDTLNNDSVTRHVNQFLKNQESVFSAAEVEQVEE